MLAFPPQATIPRIAAVAGVVAVVTGALVVRNVVTTQQAAAPATQTALAPRVQPAVVQVAPANRGAIRSVFSYAGAVQAAQQVNLVPRANGIVKTIPVEVGTTVHRGDALATLDPGTLPDTLAQARALQVAAQTKLDQLRAGARPEDVAAAQAQVDQAQAKLDGLRARPEDVASAQAALDSAYAKLSLLANGSTPDVRAAAQAGVDNAQVSLKNAQETLQKDQAALTSAQAKLTQMQGTQVQSDIQTNQASLAAAQAAYQAAQSILTCVQGATASGSGTGAVSQAQAAVNCTSGTSSSRSGSATTVNTMTYEQILQIVQANASSASAALVAAQAKLALGGTGNTQADVAAAQSAVTGAQATVNTDKNNLSAAQNNLTAAQAKLSEVQTPTPEEIAQAQATVRQAQQTLAKAQNPFTDTDIAQQQGVVSQLQAQFDAKATPFTEFDIRSAQASLDQARAAVAVAQGNLDLLTLTAPFDGVVSAKFLAPGAFASTASPILTLVGNSSEVHITVEEARLGLVRPGQSVQLVSAAYPDLPFTALVTNIAPAGDARAHTFDATIIPADDSSLLLPGMFLQVQIVASDKQEALLVPRESVLQKEGGATVFVNQDGVAQQRPVQVGLSDQTSMEILVGLSDGEQVVTVGQNSLKDAQPLTIPGQQGGGQGGAGGRPGGGQTG